MKNRIRVFSFTSAFFTVFFLQIISHASAAEILSTDHFTINYNHNNVLCAAAAASRLESYNKTITDFFQIEITDKIVVFIHDKKILPGLFNSKHNELYLSVDRNFDEECFKLYNSIFLIYLNKIMQCDKGCSLLNNNFITAVVNYPLAENSFVVVQLNDLVNISGISFIDLNKIGSYDNGQQQIIYTGLIHFILTGYGKKIFIQTLKDTYYYTGFLTSLSKITGDPENKITEKFNKYLQEYKNNGADGSVKQKILMHEIDDYKDLSFSISTDLHAAILQKHEDQYRLFFKKGSNIKDVILTQSENDSYYNDLTYLDNSQLAIVEITGSGSYIHLYDVNNKIFLNRIFIPSLYISDINASGSGILVFSASCGIMSDIYTFNVTSMRLDALTDSGSSYSPVKIDEKLYYISGREKSRLVELDITSGKSKILFSLESGISHLNIEENRLLLFPVKMNDAFSILTYDIKSGKIRIISKENNHETSPLIAGGNLYFFSFHKSAYRLFYSVYNAEYQ